MKIHFMSALRRCAVLEILMYFVYILVSVLRAPCTASHKMNFLRMLLPKLATNLAVGEG